ncbi:hypothetical protein D3C87_2133230 [compost metagenome]
MSTARPPDQVPKILPMIAGSEWATIVSPSPMMKDRARGEISRGSSSRLTVCR